MCPNSIYAIAISEDQALLIEDRLTEAGFSNDGISALIPDKERSDPFIDMSRFEAPGATANRGTTGGVFGGAIEMFANIGALAIPGVGRLTAVGPLLAALSGVAAGAVVGISGALVGLGLPTSEAMRYESRIAGGDILISVNAETPDEIRKATEVLEKLRAEDIAVASMNA